MAAQAVSLRTQIAVAIDLLRSGSVDAYGTLLDLEHHGEDSHEMRIVREVCSDKAVTDAELVLWQQSYRTTTTV